MELFDNVHVAIGSQNTAKIEAVKKCFEILFPDFEISYYLVKVDSGVGVQPIGFDSTIKGAINRARNAYSSQFRSTLENISCIGIGIEAGLIPVPYTKTGYLDYQFCAMYQSENSITIGSGPGFEYPSKIMSMLLEDPNHSEIGTIIAELSGIPNIKEWEGAIGLLSRNTFNRADILKFSVISALLPLKNAEIYSL